MPNFLNLTLLQREKNWSTGIFTEQNTAETLWQAIGNPLKVHLISIFTPALHNILVRFPNPTHKRGREPDWSYSCSPSCEARFPCTCNIGDTGSGASYSFSSKASFSCLAIGCHLLRLLQAPARHLSPAKITNARAFWRWSVYIENKLCGNWLLGHLWILWSWNSSACIVVDMQKLLWPELLCHLELRLLAASRRILPSDYWCLPEKD